MKLDRPPVLVIVGAVAGFGLRGYAAVEPPVTLVSLSPDGAYRVRLTERAAWLDRNFDVTLEDIRTGEARTVFTSPDEGPPGTERVVWSGDGSHFLLLGRHFVLRDGPAGGPPAERPYLLMNVRTGQLWCDAAQQRGLPPIPAEGFQRRWLQWPPGPAGR